MTLHDIANSRSWMFLIWMTIALLAYRTAPQAGFPLGVAAVTGGAYLICWVLLVRADALAPQRLSPIMIFQMALMALAAMTLFVESRGTLQGAAASLTLLWLIAVGLPLQGLVKLFSAAASRSDMSMAVVSIGLLAVLLAARIVWNAVFRKKLPAAGKKKP